MLYLFIFSKINFFHTNSCNKLQYLKYSKYIIKVFINDKYYKYNLYIAMLLLYIVKNCIICVNYNVQVKKKKMFNLINIFEVPPT